MKYEYLSVDGLTEYTPEHDAVMNIALNPVLGIYEKTMGKPVSVKIPNAITKPTFHSGYDYDNHPSCNEEAVLAALSEIGVKQSALCDYPRYGDTLRVFFEDTETATNFINELLN